MINKKPIIGVMGSHDTPWNDYAAPVGQLIAKRGYHLLTGAGAGVMEAVSHAYTIEPNRKGLSIGIIPTMDYSGAVEKYPNHYIELPILAPLDNKAQQDQMPYSRNYVNIMSSHAIIILPGAHGTQNEVSLALMFDKPMILFGPEGAFEDFPEAPYRADHIGEVETFLEKTVNKLRATKDFSD